MNFQYSVTCINIYVDFYINEYIIIYNRECNSLYKRQ